MIIENLEQGSLEWHQIRLGKVTGSRIKGVTAKDNLPLIDELIAEIISGQAEEIYPNAAMQRGIDLEPIAIASYEEVTGLKVENVGFVVSDKYEWLGHSPDGLIKIDGVFKKGIEIKCPSTKVHVKYIRQNKVPAEYRGQVLNLFLTVPEIEEVDFISFDDRFEKKPLHIVNTKREEVEDDLKELEASLVKFYAKFQAYYNQITF